MPFVGGVSERSFVAEHVDEGEVLLTLRAGTSADWVTWNRDWRPRLGNLPAASWPWQEHLGRAVELDGWQCLAIARERQIEALASLAVEEDSSRLKEGAATVYVEYVGVAPDHLQPPIGRRAIRGLGGILVREAARLSRQLGLEGRVGLHSKREVEGFYEALGFTAVTREDTQDGVWLYCELTPEGANALVAEEGSDGT